MAMVRLNADVDDNLVKRLRHVLVDEGLTFSEWLRRQIDAYLFEKLDLFRWWDPAELAQAVGPTSRPDDGRIIAEYRYQKHLEAWIASHFAVGYSLIHGVKTMVRMVPDKERTPDAVIRVIRGKSALDVGLEITTVQTPGRRLREEYKHKLEGDETGVRHVSIPEPEEVAEWVDIVLRGKVRSADRKMWLVVYLNPDWLDGSDFSGHVSRRYIDPWGEVHVLGPSGHRLLTLKGRGAKEWVAFKM